MKFMYTLRHSQVGGIFPPERLANLVAHTQRCTKCCQLIENSIDRILSIKVDSWATSSESGKLKSNHFTCSACKQINWDKDRQCDVMGVRIFPQH